MVKYIDIKTFLKIKKEDSKAIIIDVRSPSEYNHAHLCGAYNVYLFDDSEREIVGTLYKQEGHEAATLKGLEFAQKRMVDITETIAKLVKKNNANKVLMYCARGGMRSRACSLLSSLYGFETFVLTDGYKSYRHYVLDSFTRSYKIVMLCAKTGSAKTGILKNIKTEFSRQVIDLEMLANHKGSAFGAIGENAQSTQEQFENNLSEELCNIDINKELWLEDESLLIGRLAIPKPLFEQMKKPHKAIYITIDKTLRAKYITETYGLYSKDSLIESIKKIEKRLGNEAMREAIKLLEDNNIYECVLILLQYYDKAYRSNPDKNLSEKIIEIESDTIDIKSNSKLCIESSDNI